MSESIENLHHRIDGAEDLQAVVRTMKALSASNINQYERAVHAVDVYANTVESGLIACLRQPNIDLSKTPSQQPKDSHTGIIVFGSDQGLIGQFNDVLAHALREKLTEFTDGIHVWAIGERMGDQLKELKIPLAGLFKVPNSVNAITQLVEQLLIVTESEFIQHDISQLYVFYNGTSTDISGYTIECQHLLPLGAQWQHTLAKQKWKTNNLPETLGRPQQTLQKLISEYLFVSLFRACAESLASENASRLATMQRADKNIGEMLDELTHSYHQLRQEGIDNEMFDVVTSFTP